MQIESAFAVQPARFENVSHKILNGNQKHSVCARGDFPLVFITVEGFKFCTARFASSFASR